MSGRKFEDIINCGTISDYQIFVKACEEKIKMVQMEEHSFIFFRGQGNAVWGIEPSILRKDKQKKEHKEEYGKLWDSKLSSFENIAKIQHTYEHGIPTRFIDLTLDYKVALYFACKEQNQTEDGAIFVIEYDPVSEESIYTKIVSEFFTITEPIKGSVFLNNFLKKYPDFNRDYVAATIVAIIDFGFIVMPSERELEKAKAFCPRLFAQKGCFLVCPNSHCFKGRIITSNDVEEGILLPKVANPMFIVREDESEDQITESFYKNFCTKYVIPANFKNKILEELKEENITAETLQI